MDLSKQIVSESQALVDAFIIVNSIFKGEYSLLVVISELIRVDILMLVLFDTLHVLSALSEWTVNMLCYYMQSISLVAMYISNVWLLILCLVHFKYLSIW